jgi:selenocysteine lyase/cysteine desulfurase
MPATDLAEFRSQFPALSRFAWLNTAGVAPGARPVAAALEAGQEAWLHGTFDWREWEWSAEEARGRFATRINTPASSIALLATLADAAATVAASIGNLIRRQAGPIRIVVPEVEFRSNLFPWLALSSPRYEVVRVEPDMDGLVRTEALLAATTPGVALVAVSEVQSATGHRIDAQAIAERCHEVGARCFLNLTQSLGALRFDAQAIGADFVAAHSYKWLLAPRGATFLYVRPEGLPQMAPLAPNWKNAADLHHSDMPYANLYAGPYALASDARRLDASLSWFPWIGARAALALLDTIGAAEVEAHCLSLAAAFRDGARALGYAVTPCERPSQLTSVKLGSAEAANNLSRALQARDIVTSARASRVRFGFHAFNDRSDVERALDGLRCARAELS